MSNIDYWQRRKAMNMYHYMQSAEETSKEISKVYHKASLVLSNEMDKIFERFVTKHKLSEDDARKLLTSIKDKTSLEEIKAELRKGATGSDKRELLAELESPAYAYRLNRLEDKQQQIDNLMNTIYNQEKELSTDHYKELMGESYNRSMYEIQRQAGIGYSFDKLDSKTIDNMLKSKWSGANYSSRIWNNTQKLADSLKTELMVGLLTGEREADISKNLMFQFASGANNARRLVRTESCHIANEMDMKAYEESGIDTYVFVATLDLRTSAICASLDGKRFKVKDQQPGVNAPPMHPWCRSTTICDISDEELSQMKRRSKNPVTGKSELVPANMTYEEWQKSFVEGDKSQFKPISPMEKSNESCYTIRTKEEFENITNFIKSDITNYANNNSKWSGNINVHKDLIDGDAIGIKEWSCDIAVVDFADDGVLWHEMLHSCSASHYPPNVYSEHEFIEEATVEFLKQQICAERNIRNIGAYEDKVLILKTINDSFGYGTDLEFAKEIFNIPLPDRYQWLVDKVDESLRNANASFEDYNNVMFFLKTLEGGENG